MTSVENMLIFIFVKETLIKKYAPEVFSLLNYYSVEKAQKFK